MIYHLNLYITDIYGRHAYPPYFKSSSEIFEEQQCDIRASHMAIFVVRML